MIHGAIGVATIKVEVEMDRRVAELYMQPPEG